MCAWASARQPHGGRRADEPQAPRARAPSGHGTSRTWTKHARPRCSTSRAAASRSRRHADSRVGADEALRLLDEAGAFFGRSSSDAKLEMRRGVGPLRLAGKLYTRLRVPTHDKCLSHSTADRVGHTVNRTANSIVYVPLDDRPVTRQLPERMLGRIAGVRVVEPPRAMLGSYLTFGRPGEILAWLNRDAPRTASEYVLSSDMLAYGGLVASRVPGRRTTTHIFACVRSSK